MADLNRKQMAQLIIKLRLATPAQVQDCLDDLTDTGNDPELLLSMLSRHGLLTSLQVDKLLKGDMYGPFDKLHHDVVLTCLVVLADAKHFDDVLMSQAHSQPAFTLEHMNDFGLIGPTLPEHFDCYDPARTRVIGTIDTSESA